WRQPLRRRRHLDAIGGVHAQVALLDAPAEEDGQGLVEGHEGVRGPVALGAPTVKELANAILRALLYLGDPGSCSQEVHSSPVPPDRVRGVASYVCRVFAELLAQIGDVHSGP